MSAGCRSLTVEHRGSCLDRMAGTAADTISSWPEGLFTQEDPIGIAGGLNLYGYANGDPINFSDPFGLFPDFLLDLGFLAADIHDIRKNGLTWGRGLALGVDVVGAALPFVPAVGGVFGRAARSAERASDYIDITRGGSVANRATDVTSADFAKNLIEGGWKQSTSKDGLVQIFEKDGAKYTLRETSSGGVPTAEFFRAGSERADLKIRLGGGGE